MSAQEKSPEEKYRVLIIIGIVFSILLIIGIVITFAVTRAKIAARELPDHELLGDQIMDVITDSVSSDDYEYYVLDNVPYGYYTANPKRIETESDSLRLVLKKNCMDCGALDTLIRYLRDETDRIASEIRDLRQDFSDTLAEPGVRQTFVTSEEFFSSTEREEVLLEHLQTYRETAISYAMLAGTDSPELYKTYLPLTESDKRYVEVITWDRSVFTEEPVDVLLFLDHLELDLRYFENGILWGTVH